MSSEQPPYDSDAEDLGAPFPPSPARIYDYLLGGKDNYAVDQQAAAKVLKVLKHARTVARQNRAFMHRAAGFLAGLGVMQYVDIGTGIPTSPNLHEIVQKSQPAARVVYVDHDAVVMAHAEALMSSTEQGHVAYVQADLREPQAILDAPQLRQLDFTRPIGLSLIAVLHFLPDTDDPYRKVRTLVDALPAGSWLTISHVTADIAPEDIGAAEQEYRASGIETQVRTHQEVARFFTGLEMADPGLVLAHHWRPDLGSGIRELPDAWVSCYGAVARKPSGGRP